MAKSAFSNNKLWIVFLTVFTVICFILINQLGNVQIGDQLVFLLTQIAFVLIPGMAITLRIGGSFNTVSYIIISYCVGIGLTIASYFIIFSLGISQFTTLIMSLVAALSVFYLYKKRATLKEITCDNTGAWAFLLLMAAMVLTVVFSAISIYNTPDVSGGYTYIYQDVVWNVGNVTSATNGFPVMDIHVDGFSFGYHYFSNVFLSVSQAITNLSSYTLFCRMLPVVAAIVLSGGAYLISSSVFKNKWFAAGCAAVLTLVGQTAMLHLMWYAYATPLALGLSLVAAYCFIQFAKNIETAKITDGNFLLFLIMLAITSGTKAPLSAGIIAGAGIVILITLFKKKNVKTMLLAGILTLATFGIVYLSLVYNTHAFNGMEIAFFSIMWAVDPLPAYYATALQTFSGVLPEIAIKALCYPIFMLLNFPTVIVSLIMLFVSLLKKASKSKLLKTFLFWAILIGTIATSVTYQPGMSNQFFLDGIISLSVVALFLFVLEAIQQKSMFKKVIICGVCAVTIFYAGNLAVKTIRGADEWMSAREGENAGATLPYGAISQDEYEGMLWLKNNTEKDAVFASDRQYFTGSYDTYNARYYYYTAFSQRQCYLEGYNYISTHESDYQAIIDWRVAVLQGVYANNADDINTLKNEGVDYVVVSKMLNPELVLSVGTVVFENAGIAIYEI